jgi:hypothetical protein
MWHTMLPLRCLRVLLKLLLQLCIKLYTPRAGAYSTECADAASKGHMTRRIRLRSKHHIHITQ